VRRAAPLKPRPRAHPILTSIQCDEVREEDEVVSEVLVGAHVQEDAGQRHRVSAHAAHHAGDVGGCVHVSGVRPYAVLRG
jgi:hypothetical protein